ncbi:two-component response regulator, sigma factor PP2C-like phosphatase [Aliivibrio fischeri ES114]|uniref:Two-component response regulator, sigma factor PP2C-like phosphatase n=1 Tax=Aliivibrio fischeri (strain ATCC 700601 / ES114) TaxID=312309 RepID=Q5DYQ2_ALIF1|nr:SpoIIE family protein phosphatase [Aliivibrio fischeri]AAW88094.1 two-component response regulator, sigma factor PP2C-like phosphatase [Aliivibrio fischeri ES114]KLU80568.1 chemotaxis protein CheY [Aliivibrio fischeri]
MNSTLLFSDTKPTSLESVRVLRQSLSKILKNLEINTTVLNQCLLCFSEWSTNLVLHPIQPSKNISLTLRKSNSHWQIDIIDDGIPWDPTEQHKESELSEFSLKCGGRGIDIIQDQTDDIRYKSTIENNTLSLLWERSPSHKHPHILIVEDDAIQSKLLQAYLKSNFSITATTNGREALQFLQHNTVDLIISDIQMPEMSGLELRSQLEKENNFSIPFIFLSNLQDTNTVNCAAELGIDDFLQKPVQKTQLIHSITRVLGRFHQVYHALSEQLNQKIAHTLLPQVEAHSDKWKLITQQRTVGQGGGDFTLSRANNNNTLLLLADVMGHDESAKFFAYAYAGYVRGLMQHADLTQPSQLLSQLSNNAFKDQLLSQTMLTTCCLSFIGDDTIKISSAGHPKPLHITPRGINIIEIEGTLPGLLPTTHYKETTISMKYGERLALFTDGLFESGDTISERDTLEKAIKKQLIETLHLPIEQAINQIIKTFDALAGTPPNDDALLLLIENQ